ncbi:cytochrome P450 4C1-like [Hetaerina americana]|uniref:cytochrome P450 4C1-like n=1 Tax=Hetaerina americana TaxID=62018 RepID=UPI003A7F4F50
MESPWISIVTYSLATCLLLLSLPVFVIMGPVVMSYITSAGRRSRKLINAIPGPPILPFVGNATGFFLSRKGILQYRRENCLKYYPVYRIWYFQQPMINVVGPEYVEAILHSSKHIEKGWVYKFLQPWLGDGLLTSGGDKWFSHRKFLTPTFHFKILEEFVPLFAESGATLAEKLSVEASSGEAFDIVPVISQCTLEIICESAMGIKLDARDEIQKEYMMAIKAYGEIFYSRIAKPWHGIDCLFKLTPLYKKQEKVLNILHSFTLKVIKDKKQEYLRYKAEKENQTQDESNKERKKKVKAFLELLIESSEEKNALTDQEIREEVDTFMFEGHDTTSMAICWTIFMLANHPEIQQKVWEEIEAKFREHADAAVQGSIASSAKIYNDLLLLERCIKETLRIYPSVPFISRVLTEDFKMENYLIPSDAMVNIVISGIHMNPKVFPNPDTFDPDRFLPEAIKTRHPYAYVPFSAGPRNCIGQRFAMLEVKAVLCSILLQYKLIAVDTPKDISFMHDLVLRPCNGIKIKLEKR